MGRLQQRIIDLQRQLKLAKDALEKIAGGRSSDPEDEAQGALDRIEDLDKSYNLQGLCGHA